MANGGRQVAVVKASYTRPDNAGQSASRLHKYLEYRQQEHEQENDQEQDRYERLDESERFGDAEEWKQAARDRADEGRRSAYVHVVISPENGHELTNDDYRELLDEWTTDKNGEQLPHYAAIHRDTDNPHLHVAVARDKFQKQDLEDRKERTREMVMQQEQTHGIEPEYEQQREQQREQEAQRERERREQERERERRREEPEQELTL